MEPATRVLEVVANPHMQTPFIGFESQDQFLPALFKAIPVPLLISRLVDDVILYANQHFCSMFGLTTQEMSLMAGACTAELTTANVLANEAELLAYTSLGMETAKRDALVCEMRSPILCQTLDFFYDPTQWQSLLQVLASQGCLHNYQVKMQHTNGSLIGCAVSLQCLILNGEQAVLGAFHPISQYKPDDHSSWFMVHRNELDARRHGLASLSTMNHEHNGFHPHPLQSAIRQRHQQAEEELWESELKYRTLIERMNEGLVIIDNDGVIQFVNERYCELLGYAKDELVGKNEQELAAKAADFSLLQAKHERQKQGLDDKYEIQLRQKSGATLWALISSSPIFDAEGKPIGSMGILTDITECKQAESASVAARNAAAKSAAALRESQRRLASLMDSLPGIVFSGASDPEWSMTYLSEGSLALTGYKSEELIGNRAVSFNAITHEEDLPRVLAALETGVAQKQPYVVEYRIRTKSGEEKWVWEKGHGVFDSNGNVLGIEGFITEITERKRVEEALRASESELRALFAAMTDIIFVFDVQGRCLKIGPTNPDPKLLRKPASEMLGKTLHEVFDLEAADTALSYIQRAITTQTTVSVEYSLQTNGTELWFSASISPTQSNTVVWVARDITERKRAEEALRQAEAKYRSIFENAIEGIFQSTVDGYYLSANPALARIYGYSTPDELMERLTDIEHQLYVEPNRRAEFIRLLQENDAVSDFESQVYRKDGSIIWISENARAIRCDTGKLLYYEGSVEDITLAKLAKEQLRERAFYDALTGLPNRALFMDRLSHTVERAKRHPCYRFAVLFLDLDGFKAVNDRLGHLIGDQLLIAIARRLQSCLRAEDTVARLGGDEFTILLEDIEDISQATLVAQRIHQSLSKPFTLDGHQVFTATSIGIVLSREASLSLCTTDYDRPEDLLRDADTALYRAKALGKARYEVFNRSN